MAGNPPQTAERIALCDLMLALGPDVPTLCEGWNNIDMAAHLVVRERKPVASIGIVLPAAASLHDNAIEKAKEKYPFEQLVDKVRNGPPVTWKLVDGLFNTNEYFVHHEDVRRGRGDFTPRTPDELAHIDGVLWKGLQRGHRVATRGIKGVSIDLVAPGRETIHAGKGEDTVTITGEPGEIALYLAGRKEAANVEITGSADAVAAATGAKLGI